MNKGVLSDVMRIHLVTVTFRLKDGRLPRSCVINAFYMIFVEDEILELEVLKGNKIRAWEHICMW